MRVETIGLHKSFGTATVLSGVDVTFESGRVSAITAPSGSGKSTLLAILAGLEPVTSGAVRHILGQRVGPADPRNVAWVTQGSNALSLRTVLDNAMIGALAYGANLERARAEGTVALGQVGLLERANDRARTLSGGELQRLGFARALASARPMIFADEPSAHLDEQNTRALAEIIAALPAGTTVLIATHDPLLVEAADAVFDLRALAWVKR